MQYNHGAMGLGVVQKGQIVKFLQIRFIFCWSFRKGSIWVTLTRPYVDLPSFCGHIHAVSHSERIMIFCIEQISRSTSLQVHVSSLIFNINCVQDLSFPFSLKWWIATW
jgi:hypothetical protein